MILLEHLEVSGFKSLRSVSLCFPPHGAVLIEGLNESGKSTLFESVHFALYGRGLVTRSGGNSVEDLIAYGKPSMSVRLSLRTPSGRLVVERHASRRKATKATLRVIASNGPVEELSGVRSVNERIVAELNGLNSEALLNSCFVEQKQLSRLEDQQSGERLASLLRILNLERLVQVEASLRDEERALPSLDSARRTAALAREYAEFRGSVARTAAEEVDTAEELRRTQGRLMERAAALATLVRLEAEIEADQHEAGRGRVPDRLPLPAQLIGLLLALAGVAVIGSGRPVVGVVLLLAAAGLAAAWKLQTWMGGDSGGAVTDAARRRRARVSAQRAALGLGEGESAGSAYGEAQRLLGSVEARMSLAGGQLAGAWEPGRPVPAALSETWGRLCHEAEILGVELTELDPDAAGALYRDLSRRARVLKHERELLARVRERILSAVLPDTERNMQLILPRLTAGRYHDARVDEQYRIQAWDEGAGEYVPKQVFSGGTKDQFSLALRLAFALASLPQELGASPGFLFLDEPLSAFDEERTAALIHLITRGELAEAFPQIYLISHSRAFDRSSFPYTLEMDGGSVRRSTLPECSCESVA